MMQSDTNLMSLFQASIKGLIREVLDEFLEDNKEDLIEPMNTFDTLQLLTISEVCSLLKISKPTIYRLLKSGQLKQTKLTSGRKGMVRFRRIDVENYLLVSSK